MSKTTPGPRSRIFEKFELEKRASEFFTLVIILDVSKIIIN